MHAVTRLMGKFLLNEMRGKPRLVNLEVTLRCNAQCKFCSHWRQRPGEELTDFVPLVRHFNPMAVNLTGGEPLLRADLPQIVSGIKRAGPFYVSLLTNGSLLTLAKARELRASGLDGLSISLNYLGEAHDKERNIPGLFQHLATIVPELRPIGFSRIDLNTVLMEDNLDQVLPLAQQARAWGAGLCLSCYSSLKTHRDHGVQNTAELFRIVRTLRQLKHQGWPVGSSDWYLQRVELFHRNGGIRRCQAGRRTVHITPAGQVKPCPDLPAVGHYSRYHAHLAPALDCTSCWYRCRGEVEAPLTPSQVLDFVRRWRSRTPAWSGQ